VSSAVLDASAVLALGLSTGLPVLTGDGKWEKLDLGVKVELIRRRGA
jgi:PIN domain nuclease of toxin-antitoxin system